MHKYTNNISRLVIKKIYQFSNKYLMLNWILINILRYCEYSNKTE